MATSPIGTPYEYLDRQLPQAPLAQIADIIRKNWDNLSPFAMPYVAAMLHLSSLEDTFGAEDGRSIVLYFLANAQTWRGPVARLVKAELNRRLEA